jgi:hypothetical protein
MEALAKPTERRAGKALALRLRGSPVARLEWPPDMNAHDTLLPNRREQRWNKEAAPSIGGARFLIP